MTSDKTLKEERIATTFETSAQRMNSEYEVRTQKHHVLLNLMRPILNDFFSVELKTKNITIPLRFLLSEMLTWFSQPLNTWLNTNI